MQVASFLIHKILTPESIRDLITILEIVKKIIIILTKTWSLQPQIWHECPRWASDMRTSTNQTNVVIVYPSWKIALKELIIFNSFEVNMVKRLCLEDSCTQHYFSSKSFFQIGIILCFDQWEKKQKNIIYIMQIRELVSLECFERVLEAFLTSFYTTNP